MSTLVELPFRQQEMINRELEPGEQVVWAARAGPRFFTPGTTGAFLFGIAWTAFSVFSMSSAACGAEQVQTGSGLFSGHSLVEIPFILVGFGLISSPIWPYWKALKTAYVVTDRRAITFEGGWSTTVRSYRPDKLRDVYRREHRKGTGDVIITRRAWYDSEGSRQTEELGFLRIPDATYAESLLKDLARIGDG